MSDRPYVPVSPLTWEFRDYLGRALTISVTFNASNGNLTGATVVREAGCLYRTLLWGLGSDGVPDNSTRKRIVPFGTSTVTRNQLNAIGLTTVTELLSFQFTVGF